MKIILKILLLLLTISAFFSCQKDPDLPVIPPLDQNEYPTTKLDSILEYYPICNMWDIKTPPYAVSDVFYQQFSNVKDVEWEEGCGLYEVSFEVIHVDYEAFYNGNGVLLFYKQDIPNRNIPNVVRNAINSRYSNYRIDDADKVFMENSIYYDVDLDNHSDRDLEICVKENGAIVYERFEFD